MKDNRSKEWSLGLQQNREETPTAKFWEFLYFQATSLMDQLGTPATHISIVEGWKKSKWQKHGGPRTKKLIASGFSGIRGFGLGHAPTGSEVVERDRLAYIDGSFIDSIQTLSLTISLKDSVVKFQEAQFSDLLESFLKSGEWDFGWSLIDDYKNAQYHVICMDHPRLREEERNPMNRWYSSTAAEQIIKPRDVYPVNVFHANHLELMVGGRTLGEFIREAPGTRVEVIAGHTVWTVPPEMVDGLREELGAAGVLIARG